MNKKKIVLGILLDLVFLVVFNVCFFVIGGTNHSVAAWMAYGFNKEEFFCLYIWTHNRWNINDIFHY